MIDLRSDTITKPTPGMLDAMFSAKVGDDVYEEDPTVNELEERLASMFGMEAGIFCPSGTMTNQIGIRLFTQPQSEVICDRTAHIYNYEGGGIAYNSFSSVRLVDGVRGIITPEMVLENINPENVHYPQTTLVALENTVNKGGGCYYSLSQIRAVSEVCKDNNLYLHLDGARVFNAIVETGEDPAEYGKYFDGISICMSKGMGAPVGSVLLASRKNIKQARRIRKVFGGGMRQAGYLAAACIYALDNHLPLLKEDHRRARIIGEIIRQTRSVVSMLPVETNIVIFSFKNQQDTDAFLDHMNRNNVKVSAFGKFTIRIVTHLDFDDAMLDKLIALLKKY
jgi:threonine aldolase